MTPQDEIRVDIYCRVSTLEQAEEGYSLHEQEARLTAYAAAQGWTIHAVYTDPGYSGTNLNRPGIQRLIDDVQNKRVQRVLTYKLDRLSRSPKNTLYLIEDLFLPNNIGYVSLTESLDTSTSTGMAMIGMLSVYAKLERDLISERMMMGRVAAAKQGRWRGGSGVPIGYRYTPRTATEMGKLEIDEYEAAQIREIFEMFLAGKSYHAIWVTMHERCTTSYGRFGSGGASIIPKILTNRAYIGEIKYQGIWYQGLHEPIIDRETFDRVQSKHAEYQAGLCAHRRTAYQAKHLLTGLLWCGECGARWCYHTVTYKRKSDGEKRSYDVYTCYTKARHKTQAKADGCSISVWPAAELEAVVWDQVESLAFQEPAAGFQSDSEVQAYNKRIADIDRQLARLVELYAVDSMPMEVIRARAESLTQERQQLAAAVAAANQKSGRLTPAEMADAADRALTLRDSADLAAKRELLQLLVKRIVLGPDRAVVIEWNI